ncbi:MAG: hypothetical protein QG570_275, partial [Patescibacteria group bacterium]|nr:hypothetical protein [Patescibacteria group bacterium]
ANKLDEGDIQLTIPLIILISLMMYVLNLLAYSALSKKFTKHIKAKITMVSYLVYVTLLFIVTFPVYKEVGSDVIFVPLLAGIIAGLMRSFIKPRSVFNEILEVVLCVMLPFQIAGFMGVGLSILTFYLCYSMVGVLINNFKTANMLSIVKLSPLLYLLASQEIRENKGLINRLDITNGYQLGWILICLILVKFVALYYQPFLDWLEKNELSKFIQTLVPLFTLVIFVIIIRLGRAEGAIALITSFVAFLYIYNLFEKRLHREQLRLTSSLAQFAGTLTFLVLTTF